MDMKRIKANKLKTILQFSIPSIIAMLLQTVITITDGYFTEYYMIMLFNYPIMVMGTVSGNVTNMVALGFRIYAVTFLVMGYDVINSMYFTSCGDAKSSALISSLRGIILLLGFTLFLPAILGMTGVWMTAPCTEVLTAFVSVCMLRRQKKHYQKGKHDIH